MAVHHGGSAGIEDGVPVNKYGGLVLSRVLYIIATVGIFRGGHLYRLANLAKKVIFVRWNKHRNGCHAGEIHHSTYTGI
jgi:hypothetical protein